MASIRFLCGRVTERCMRSPVIPSQNCLVAQKKLAATAHQAGEADTCGFSFPCAALMMPANVERG